MSDYDLRELLLSGHAPTHIRLLMAQGAMPLPAQEAIELLVHLTGDDDGDISSQASETITTWNELEILAILGRKDCPAIIFDYFADTRHPEHLLDAIAANPAAPGKTIAHLATSASLSLLDAILDNRMRILEFPAILESIRRNPSADARILGLVQEIEIEFLGEKRTDYTIESAVKTEDEETDVHATPETALDFEAEIEMLLSTPPPPDIELSLEELPLEIDAGDSNINARIATMPPKEKIKYALFGTREIRAILIRDTNREVARTVLRSPKLRENEVEAIAAMRNVSEDIIREISNRREWIKNAIVVYNLARNPKTPTAIAQRLMPRLRAHDLNLMARDRSIPDATRNCALRLVKQRATKGQGR